LDLIVANPVPWAFGNELNKATLIEPDGTVTDLEPLPKEELAEIILDRVAARLKTPRDESHG
jgi:phosphopantothenoylcysteine synthetase/decarboxylase